MLGNHDKSRIATRVGSSQARVAAMLLLTLPGTLILYYGDEIGMTDVPIPFDEVRDPAEKNEPGIGLGRDPERTPMPWDGSPLAGFTTARPWLLLGADHAVVNVESQELEQVSILQLYRKLIALRRSYPTLVSGNIRAIAAENDVLRFERIGIEDRILVLLNIGAGSAQSIVEAGTILLSTEVNRDGEGVHGVVNLGGAEGLIIQLVG